MFSKADSLSNQSDKLSNLQKLSNNLKHVQKSQLGHFVTGKQAKVLFFIGSELSEWTFVLDWITGSMYTVFQTFIKDGVDFLSKASLEFSLLCFHYLSVH
jgi:hypothetical protein